MEAPDTIVAWYQEIGRRFAREIDRQFMAALQERRLQQVQEGIELALVQPDHVVQELNSHG
jgi:hypothetical protein